MFTNKNTNLKILILFLNISLLIGCYSSPHKESDVYSYIAEHISDAPCIITKETKEYSTITWDVYFLGLPTYTFEVKSVGGVTAAGLLPSGHFWLNSNCNDRFQEFYINDFYEQKGFHKQESKIQGRSDFVNDNGQKGKLYFRWNTIYGDFHNESEIPDVVKEMKEFLTFIEARRIHITAFITCCYPKDGYTTNSYSYRSDKNTPDEIELGLRKIVEEWEYQQSNK